MHVGFRKVLHGSVSDLQSDKCFASLQEEKTAENTENCFYMKRIKCKDLEYICTKNHFLASSVCSVLYKLLVTFGCHLELNWLVIDMKHSCKFLHMCIMRPSSGLIVEQQQLIVAFMEIKWIEQTDRQTNILILKYKERQTNTVKVFQQYFQHLEADKHSVWYTVVLHPPTRWSQTLLTFTSYT